MSLICPFMYLNVILNYWSWTTKLGLLLSYDTMVDYSLKSSSVSHLTALSVAYCSSLGGGGGCLESPQPAVLHHMRNCLVFVFICTEYQRTSICECGVKCLSEWFIMWMRGSTTDVLVDQWAMGSMVGSTIRWPFETAAISHCWRHRADDDSSLICKITTEATHVQRNVNDWFTWFFTVWFKKSYLDIKRVSSMISSVEL